MHHSHQLSINGKKFYKEQKYTEFIAYHPGGGECKVFRQTLEIFDQFLIGLTAGCRGVDSNENS